MEKREEKERYEYEEILRSGQLEKDHDGKGGKGGEVGRERANKEVSESEREGVKREGKTR